MKTIKLTILTLSCALGLAIPATAQDSESETDDPAGQALPADGNPEDGMPAVDPSPAEPQALGQTGQVESTDAATSDAEAARMRELEAMVRLMVAEAMAYSAQQSNTDEQGEAVAEPVRPTQTTAAPPETSRLSPPDGGPLSALATTPETATGATFNASAVTTNGDQGLRMNFRNAPIDLVLDYLAEAAGFTIVLDTAVSGTFDVWNVEPLSKEEAVELLNKVLNKKGYAVARSGKTLTVYSALDRPPVIGPVAGPQSIPPTDELVTQILQVKYVSASQLIRELQPLLPASSMTIASDGGNKIVIQDTRANIRRMYEIIDALDKPLASVSTIKVIPLQHADAQTLATVINNLYQGQEQRSRGGSGSGFNPFQQFFQGRGDRGGGSSGGGGGGRGRD